MKLVQTITAALLFVLFAWLAAMNARVFWNTFVRRQSTPSWIPLVGGLCGMLSLLVVPVPGAGRWWWVPLLVDWGSIPGIAVSIAYALLRPRGD